MRWLITHGSGPSARLLPLIEPHLSAYARRHGYQLLISDQDSVAEEQRAPQWEKIALLRKHLPRSELCLWLDSDIILAEQSLDIAEEFHPEDFHALCMEQTPHGPGPNTGVWLLRNCERAHCFLQAVWERGQPAGARLQDQAAVGELLGWSVLPERTRPLHPSPWLNGTGWLDPSWNTLAVHQPVALPHARGLHYGGMESVRKTVLMEQALIDRRLPGWQACLPPETRALMGTSDG